MCKKPMASTLLSASQPLRVFRAGNAPDGIILTLFSLNSKLTSVCQRQVQIKKLKKTEPSVLERMSPASKHIKAISEKINLSQWPIYQFPRGYFFCVL